MKKSKTLILTAASAFTFMFTSCFNLSNLINVTDSGGSDSLEISKTESQEKMKQLGSTKGYEITLEIKDADSDGNSNEELYTYGYKDDCFWIIKDNDGDACKKDGEKLHFYDATRESNGNISYTYDYSLDSSDNSIDETFNTLSYQTNVFLYWTNDYDGNLKKTGSTTVAGRACTHYTYGSSANIMGLYAGVQYDIDVDNETGITMQVKWDASTNEGSASYYHKVTSFKTGNDVQVPDFPEPTESED